MFNFTTVSPKISIFHYIEVGTKTAKFMTNAKCRTDFMNRGTFVTEEKRSLAHRR